MAALTRFIRPLRGTSRVPHNEACDCANDNTHYDYPKNISYQFSALLKAPFTGTGVTVESCV
jgi:hypothetical protein